MTWNELAIIAGAETPEVAEHLLWNRTAFPFAPIRTVWYQLRHAVRCRYCGDWDCKGKPMGGPSDE